MSLTDSSWPEVLLPCLSLWCDWMAFHHHLWTDVQVPLPVWKNVCSALNGLLNFTIPRGMDEIDVAQATSDGRTEAGQSDQEGFTSEDQGEEEGQEAPGLRRRRRSVSSSCSTTSSSASSPSSTEAEGEEQEEEAESQGKGAPGSGHTSAQAGKSLLRGAGLALNATVVSVPRPKGPAPYVYTAVPVPGRCLWEDVLVRGVEPQQAAVDMHQKALQAASVPPGACVDGIGPATWVRTARLIGFGRFLTSLQVGQLPIGEFETSGCSCFFVTFVALTHVAMCCTGARTPLFSWKPPPTGLLWAPARGYLRLQPEPLALRQSAEARASTKVLPWRSSGRLSMKFYCRRMAWALTYLEESPG